MTTLLDDAVWLNTDVPVDGSEPAVLWNQLLEAWNQIRPGALTDLESDIAPDSAGDTEGAA